MLPYDQVSRIDSAEEVLLTAFSLRMCFPTKVKGRIADIWAYDRPIDPNPADENCGPEYGFELPLADQRLLWIARPRPINSEDFYNFTQFTIGLNEFTPSLRSARFHQRSPKKASSRESGDPLINGTIDHTKMTTVGGPFLPPSDSRFRPDIRALEQGNIDTAALEKTRLEEKQRHVRKLTVSQQSRPRSSQSTGGLSNNTQQSLASNNLSSRSKGSETSLLLPHHPRAKPTRSRSSIAPPLIVGPVWFHLGYTEATKQEEWKFTGDYWSRDWSRCPDLY
ncbi:unnamed protein product [Echinostoma caproni]|uniref:Uncharacterized protein n=1 Tax=Echinostoma caproni TaxID=27848 RepID=A0A183AWJ2_9TREM|nr:unnamed protein product [Echinostoma caproni]